jgi:acylpyruvate hydrolase
MTTDNTSARLGALLEIGPEHYLVDLAAMPAHAGSQHASANSPPGDMLGLLQLGSPALDAVRARMAFAATELAKPSTAAEWRARRIIYREDEVRFFAPVLRPGKIIMVGANYKTHVGESSTGAGQLPAARAEQHTWPVAFSKFPSTLIGHRESIVYPRHTAQLDYEAELCVVVGKRCKDVAESAVDDVIAGYTIANDVSMRDIQFAEMRRGLLLLGKNLDTAAPMGPYLVTSDEIPDPQDVQIKCWVNGELRQDDSTANMTFSVRQLVSYFSRMTLEPGDIIATGTPAGVGIFWKPPEAALLRIGDVIDIEIKPIGRLSNTVIADQG